MKAYFYRSSNMESADQAYGFVCKGETFSDLTADFCRRRNLPVDRGGKIYLIEGVGGVRHHIMTIINRGNVRQDGWEARQLHILLPGDTGYPKEVDEEALPAV